MATLRNLGGFETEDTSELQTNSSATVSTSAPIRTGTAALNIAEAGTQRYAGVSVYYGGTLAAASNSEAYWVLGVAVRFSTLAPSSGYSFLMAIDGLGTSMASLSLETNGDMKVLPNSFGAAVATITAPFASANTWYYVEFGMQINNSASWQVWVDGVSKGSGSGADFVAFSTSLNELRFGGPIGAGGATAYFDDYYTLSDTVSIPTPLHSFGPPSVVAYQGAKASATPDTGSNLNTGTWDLIAEAPLDGSSGHLATYSSTNVNGYITFDDPAGAGHGPGPLNGRYPIAKIHGAKWFGKYLRSAIGSGTLSMYYGHNGDVTNSGDMGLTTTAAWRGIVLDSTNARCPTTDESFVMGMGTSNTYDITCHEQFAFLLVVLLHTELLGRPYGNPGAIQMQQLLAT